MTELLNDLEKGNYFKAKSETVLEKDLLKAAIEKMKRQIKNLEQEIVAIKQSETFMVVSDIKDWDLYFRTTKEKLKDELNSLKSELSDLELT